MSTLIESVEVPASLLSELQARLTERKNLLEREVLKYGEPPSGIKEVFELCRGFERAYVTFVNESPTAGKVKECFMGEKGLAGLVRTAPLENVFKLANVKAACRYADGYQPHLVSPERGVRALAQEALDLVAGPVKGCVQGVHTLLINAAREAAEKAGEHTEAALIGTALPMYVPEFKTVIMPTITTALDEWKDDAEKMALMLVDMERTYITAGFFRSIMSNRLERIQLQDQMQQQQQYQQQSQQGGRPPASGQAPPVRGPPEDKGKSFFPAFGGAAGADQTASKDDSDDEGGVKSGQPANLSNMSNDPNDFVAAFFDKSGSNIDSPMAKSMPSALSWQRRFFILSDSQKMLYYFKSPDDVPKPNGLRGQVNVSECLVDDLDDKGQPRGPGSAPPNPSDKAHFMLRIRHKDPRQSVVKEHNSMILRADSLQVKSEWLTRLRKATGELKKAERPSKPPAAAEPQHSTSGEEGGERSMHSTAGGGPLGLKGPAATATGDLAWAKEAEPVLDTHLGQGAKLFRADTIRDPDGRLPPAPRVLLNPIRMADRATGAIPSFEVQYDALLEQFGSDMNMYTRMVCDTVCTTVPKAVVHCLIRKSEKNLLEKLFTVIHKLTPEQMESLLKEEDAVVARRQIARKMFEDVKSAVFQVHQHLERRHMTAEADRPDAVPITVNAFAYAGMPEQLSSDQRTYFDKLFSDQYAPEALRFWQNPPAGARALPPPPSPGVQGADGRPQQAGGSPGGAPPQQGSPGQQGAYGYPQGGPQGQGAPPLQRPPPPGVPGRAPPPPGPGYGGPPPGAGPYGPPPGVGPYGAPPGGVRPPPPMGAGQVPMRPPGPGGAPPPVPMRPAPGQAPPPVMRRAPPPPPGPQR